MGHDLASFGRSVLVRVIPPCVVESAQRDCIPILDVTKILFK
jgi:hypothetical protein